MDEMMVEAYVSGVSQRKMGDVTEALLGERVGRSTVSRVAKRLDGAVEALRSAPIEGPHPYLYLDATFLDARWASRKVENVSALVAYAVDLAEITARWQEELPEAMRVLERGFTAATQFYAFPEPHWARLRTTNSLERLHTEIKRRIRSAGAFPDRASALRLITAVALRTTAVWSERRYLDLSLLEPKELAKAA